MNDTTLIINPPIKVNCDGVEWVNSHASYRSDGTGRIWCYNCNMKLYAYQGNRDIDIACPHPETCIDRIARER